MESEHSSHYRSCVGQITCTYPWLDRAYCIKAPGLQRKNAACVEPSTVHPKPLFQVRISPYFGATTPRSKHGSVRLLIVGFLFLLPSQKSGGLVVSEPGSNYYLDANGLRGSRPRHFGRILPIVGVGTVHLSCNTGMLWVFSLSSQTVNSEILRLRSGACFGLATTVSSKSIFRL